MTNYAWTRGGTGPTTVHRKALLESLADELPTYTIRFSSKLASIQAHNLGGSSFVTLQMEDGISIKTKVTITGYKLAHIEAQIKAQD